VPIFIYGCVCLWSINNIFYWDTVQLGAKHATHFYDTSFTQWLLPDVFDSGHIPIFGMYLATIWKIFGKNLIVSHLAMWPFVIGILYQGHLWVKHKIDPQYAPLAFLILMLEPTILAQCSLISPDVVLIYAFIHLLNIIDRDTDQWIKYLVSALLGIISMRGTMVLIVIYLYEITIVSTNARDMLKTGMDKYRYYAPAMLLWVTYMGYHYCVKGWIGYHDQSPWAPCFTRVDIYGVFKNMLILGWRMCDFGRVILWIFLVWFIIKFKLIVWTENKNLVLLFIMLVIGLGYSFVTYSGLQGSRYLMPIYWVVATLCVSILSKMNHKQNMISWIIICGLASGHLWRYPGHISQSWDASLAYTPYMHVREEVYRYIEHQDIPSKDIGCVFPNLSEKRYLDLSSSYGIHQPLNIGVSPYILWSNIYNDIQPEMLQAIKQKYAVVYTVKKLGISMVLYKLQ
jgi:hypothetical protein